MAEHRQTPEQASAERTPDAPPAADTPSAGVANEAATAAGGPEGAAPGAEAGAEAAGGIPGFAMPGDAAALAEAQARVAEYHDAFLRAKAEMENIRRRAQEDVSKAHKYAIENFAEALVPVADSLEAALAAKGGTSEQLREGVEITLRQLVSAFEKARLAPIDPKGERFDPNRHQAISMVPSAEVPAQHVVAVLQKGWMIADRVLRPALVTVSNGTGG